MRQKNEAEYALAALEGLSLYRGALDSGPGRVMGELLASLSRPGVAGVRRMAASLFDNLAGRAGLSHIPPAGNLWQNHLLDEIMVSDNTFTRMAAGGLLIHGVPAAGAVMKAAAADLAHLKSLLDLDFYAFARELPEASIHLELIGSPMPDQDPALFQDSRQADLYQLKKTLLSAGDWKGMAETLAAIHRRCGSGIFSLYYALRWDGREKKLAGIPHPDPVRLEQLVGYENERGQVIQNTELLLAGLPAGNILLYGDRGTGKSSTVKALLHRYGRRGLRIIELPRAFLDDYHEVLSSVEGTGLKFIIFVDDLSFEEHESDYKGLKSMMDGSLRKTPENTVIYATSNRRHLVREFFRERQDEVGNLDTMQEKLSLSDRFSTTVLFISPDQELYLEIVENLARQNGIDMPRDRLRMRALDWERWHNCRSGRTARQFIDHLLGSNERGHTSSF